MNGNQVKIVEYTFHLNEKSLICAINGKWGFGNSKVDIISSEKLLINGR